ncbi:MAG: YwbE family protein [Sulfurimonas sp.]|nr:MAG: YwbE family protein [Sulfurimonas sp.]
MEGTLRHNVKSGAKVAIVQKHDQRTQTLTQGIVKDILTGATRHPHGIKVRLTNGLIGRIKKIY